MHGLGTDFLGWLARGLIVTVWFGGWLGCSAVGRQAAGEKGVPTNMVFILADDFGIMDAQGYAAHFTGTPLDSMFYETPNLNRLMREGTSFSQAYATQLCSPTRAGLLSGKFAPRVGFMTAMPLRETYYNQNLPVPAGYYAHDVLDHHDDIAIEQAWVNATSNSALAPEVVTIAEAMPDHDAAFIGKWHIGGFGARGLQPQDQGFTPLAYFDGGGSTYYNWRAGWNQQSIARFPEMPQAEWAIGMAGPETGEAYLTDDLTAQALDYLDRRAATPDEPFFLYFSHFAVHSPYQGKEAEVARYTTKNTKGWNGHFDPVYASMIEGLDRSIGQLITRLEQNGQLGSTLIVFMSDNGGIDHKLTPRGDGTDNRPFLGGKAMLTEGGIRVPLVVWQPGKIGGGNWVDTPVDYTDIYPTLLDATGYDARAAIAAQRLDGESLLPLLGTAAGTYDKDTRYWHYPFNVIYRSPYDTLALTPHSAIRVGDHKLIFDWYGRLHLYDLASDPSELRDLAGTEPARRDALFAQLMDWLDEHVDRRYWPTLNPDYAAEKEARRVPFRNLVGTQ
ncbi:Multifunctional alkaline phosphatase superfamily protein PehA [Neolewinella maritima]|uniref:Multifunctional alkaline phosphatase superfamily protein PehA n=1 Tax=Neolewinella maritima TaxID=1383882 RepID=A0ABM9B3F1_9BACT|nr:sulfatase-like hydrolase/transferase [Neolewinella maritima]CAH1001862.1 Multifunctional alkaline phosphatase superfamily protein PehA [Neolewinella maritima]